MTEKQQRAYDRLLEIDRKINMIGHIEAVLGYDFETVMSKMGGEERSEQMAFLSSMIHEMSTSKELGECLEVLDCLWRRFVDDTILAGLRTFCELAKLEVRR